MININIVEKYCCEDFTKIENWEKAVDDKTKVWVIHHRNGIEKTQRELVELGLYYNRPASELIFLTNKDHVSLHSSQPKGKYVYRDDCGELRYTNTINIMSKPKQKQKRTYWRGHLYQKRGRGAWRVRWVANGKLHDVSTHCMDREEAEKKSRSIIEEYSY